MKTMKTVKIAPALLAACLLSSACLENEESIEVRPDGSVQVGITASGDVEDLTRGYSLPLHAPWQALDSVTRAWKTLFGPGTGGPEVRARYEAGVWDEVKTPTESEVTLRSAAHFGSVADIPRFLVPEDEPYRTAFLERKTSLDIEPKGTRTVYTFEREYLPPLFRSAFEDDLLPEDVLKRIEQKRRLTNEQVRRLTTLIRERAHTPAAMRLITSALGAVYSDGDASLSAAGYERVVRELHAVVEQVITEENLRAFFDALHDIQGDEGAQIPEGLDLEQRLRTASRAVISSALEREGVEEQVRHAILERLEWNFTSLDHAKDLEDEKFTLHVALPGTIVDGNYDVIVNGWATWQFDGKELLQGRRTLRLVSVLE